MADAQEFAAIERHFCSKRALVRLEEGWRAYSDSTADSIEPPVAGGKPAGGVGDLAPASHAPYDAADDGEKVARLPVGR